MQATINIPDPATLKQRFDDDGYIAVSPLFDAGAMVKINTELDRYITEVVPGMRIEEVFYEDRSDPSTLKQLQNMFTYDRFFQDLIENPSIKGMAATVLGEDVRPVNLQYFNKPPGLGKPTPPHQDGYYFHLKPAKAVTCWLALDAVDDENGCIHYLRGSHKVDGYRPHGRSNILGFSQGMTDFGGAEDQANTVAFPGSPGTFLMHHCKTVHWAGANRSSTRTRRALGLIYYGQSAKVDEAARDAYQARLEAALKAEQKI